MTTANDTSDERVLSRARELGSQARALVHELNARLEELIATLAEAEGNA